MRILYCASEANPFCGSGGLADVAGSLPHTLCRKGQDCRIVVPLYGTIPQELRNSLNFITNFTVPVAWRHQYCGLFWARWHDCTYYFIDNEYYFKRGTLYGHYDDAERFAFSQEQFSKCSHTLTSILILFTVMTGRQHLYLFTTICSIHTDHGITISRACLQFTIFSIRVNTAGKLIQNV